MLARHTEKSQILNVGLGITMWLWTTALGFRRELNMGTWAMSLLGYIYKTDHQIDVLYSYIHHGAVHKIVKIRNKPGVYQLLEECIK